MGSSEVGTRLSRVPWTVTLAGGSGSGDRSLALLGAIADRAFADLVLDQECRNTRLKFGTSGEVCTLIHREFPLGSPFGPHSFIQCRVISKLHYVVTAKLACPVYLVILVQRPEARGIGFNRCIFGRVNMLDLYRHTIHNRTICATLVELDALQMQLTNKTPQFP